MWSHFIPLYANRILRCATGKSNFIVWFLCITKIDLNYYLKIYLLNLKYCIMLKKKLQALGYHSTVDFNHTGT